MDKYVEEHERREQRRQQLQLEGKKPNEYTSQRLQELQAQINQKEETLRLLEEEGDGQIDGTTDLRRDYERILNQGPDGSSKRDDATKQADDDELKLYKEIACEPTVNDREATQADLTRVLRDELERLKQEKTKTEAMYDWYGVEDDEDEEKTMDKNPTPIGGDLNQSQPNLEQLGKERMARQANQSILRSNA